MPMDPTRRPAETVPDVHAITPRSAAALVERAAALQREAAAGTPAGWLRGKKLALLCEPGEVLGSDADLIERAARDLGAWVAQIHPRLGEDSTAHDVQQTAHMLGRLYDGVVCEGLAPSLVRRLRSEADVPVHDRILSTSRLLVAAEAMKGVAATPAERQRYLLQALLIEAVA